MKYYIDACIWRDYFENRSDNFRPLGEWAFKLIKKAINEGELIIYSDLVVEELKKEYSDNQIIEMFSIVPIELLSKVEISEKQVLNSAILSRKLNIPRKDMLHAVLAKDNEAILVSRDKHFHQLERYVDVKQPEDLI